MIVRHETSSDIEAITRVTEQAFKHHSFSLQTEQFTIRDLRADGALTLSLVTEIDGQVVGHIAFSPVTVSDGTPDWHCLGPVSVLPAFQGCRIGTEMITNGLALLKSMGSRGCAVIGLPTYHGRFGFRHYSQLFHEGTPRAVFTANPFSGQMPSGELELHQAFKQLSQVEKEAIADIIVDHEISGVMVDESDAAIRGILKKKLLAQLPNGRFMLQPSAIAAYDSYFARVAQFRATEMSRVHKNPFMTAIRS